MSSTNPTPPRSDPSTNSTTQEQDLVPSPPQPGRRSRPRFEPPRYRYGRIDPADDLEPFTRSAAIRKVSREPEPSSKCPGDRRRKKVCQRCFRRPTRFRYNQQWKVSADHDLCERCFREILRSEALASVKLPKLRSGDSWSELFFGPQPRGDR